MRIRTPFAASFTTLLLLLTYLTTSPLQPALVINDKILHLLAFFLLTLLFYWILDTSRRRVLHLTLITCTLALGIGSEFLQAFLPNARVFDIFDLAANVVGSLAALGLCAWYHRRMAERRRRGRERGYAVVDGDDEEEGGEPDLELGERVIGEDIEREDGGGGGITTDGPSLEEEVDRWDENGVDDDWDEEDENEDIAKLDGSADDRRVKADTNH
ncbi:MAG: hypothetical protein M1817_004279 [Caeruleum heppii]|nr:MAG: hypothetical protein M1817_004279 [Caeruleum heppii]